MMKEKEELDGRHQVLHAVGKVTGEGERTCEPRVRRHLLR